MRNLSQFAKSIIRFIVVWLVDGLSLIMTAWIFPGIQFVTPETQSAVLDAFAAAFLLGVVNLLIRPLLLLIARPLGFIAVFVIGFFVNALALLITSWLLPAFQVDGLLTAILGGLLFSAINGILTGILEVKDEGSFYQGLIERLARRNSFENVEPDKRGLVMMEIDGLSYHHLRKAIDDGRMPTLKRMMDEQGYELSRVDCGIPSQTSACQAGIMFGDNNDIPAFRWYDKDKQKLYVSGNDADELNSRYANGNGLMRGGSSINNMLNGDAEKSLLTLAGLFEANDEEKKRRAEDVYLLLLNPYFLTHTLVLFFVDVVREVWEGWQQRRQQVEPRLNRLAHGYPFVRAATTVLMRDVAANLTMLDIIRGAPSIYVTWPGYDEVAHHSGPWTEDAFKVLATYDHVIARVQQTIKKKAPRPYDLIILSDHGQSFGKTFKQRYGLSLKETIEQLLPHGTTVAQSMGGDTGVTSITAVSGELENIQRSGVGSRPGRAVARRGGKMLDKGAQKRAEAEGADESAHEAQVTAYGSGNLAQVYFDLYPRKILLSELNEAYPGMVDALVAHEGIGIVCGYDDDGIPVVLSKKGKLNLHTGEVSGENPLRMYTPDDPYASGASTLETRTWQVRRVMDFPNAGDLMVISTVYEDGTVAALEELIGNHGGLGGEQTDAFLLHPPDIEVTQTRNAIDVFHILNQYRDQPVDAPTEQDHAATVVEDEWSPGNLWQGIKDVRQWGSYARHALILERSAYQEVASNKRMTGPALLLGFGFSMLSALLRADPGDILIDVLLEIALWPLAVWAMFAAGRLLTRKGYFTRTMRALGFAQVVHIFDLLLLIPAIAPLAVILTTIVGFLATWMGAAEAHETRGWRTFILPFLGLLIIILVPVVLVAMTEGVAIGLEAVLERLGLIQP
ncbi:MAG: phage holin family protein [Candidatus Promineifilaceae bacterium]|nr:phage holin family protein [Candidatus Promineifilaceae bacterium]